jgi:16S rRNA (guanine527-N7)-methyltransferase
MSISPMGNRLFEESCKLLDIDLVVPNPQFSLLYDLLVEGSRRTNLTSLRSESDIILRHFVDSLTCLKTGLLDSNASFLDLGTGAGFPGIPLAIARPQLQATLLDGTQKKIDFVQQCLTALGLLQARAIWGRAELLGRQPDWRDSFDRVVTRAVGSVPMMLELALPLLKVGGYLILQKGPEVDQEVERNQQITAQLGAQWADTLSVELPQGAGSRRIIIVRKVVPTAPRYPRAGAALGRF